MPEPESSNRDGREREAERIDAESGKGDGDTGHRVSDHAGEPPGANPGANAAGEDGGDERYSDH